MLPETPEERELKRKRLELAKLESELAERELELATVQGELAAFERHYLRVVGVRYAQLDELGARIAETSAARNPQDTQARQEAAQAHERARESAKAIGALDVSLDARPFAPSDSLKKLYREVTKAVHPDLASNEEERAKRGRLMAEANKAYAECDEARLEAILREWKFSPDSVKGTGTEAELVRTIRRIARVEERLRIIAGEIENLRASDLFKLRLKVDEAKSRGRNYLDEMAARLDKKIGDAKERTRQTLKA